MFFRIMKSPDENSVIVCSYDNLEPVLITVFSSSVIVFAAGESSGNIRINFVKKVLPEKRQLKIVVFAPVSTE